MKKIIQEFSLNCKYIPNSTISIMKRLCSTIQKCIEDDQQQKLSGVTFLILVVFIAGFLVYGMLNYDCNIATDAAKFLRSAASLAKGNYYLNYPPDKIFLEYCGEPNTQIGTYETIIKDGKGISYYAIGYPLFLAGIIALGDISTPLLANVFVFALFFLLIYLFTGLVFEKERNSDLISLVAVFLYFLVIKKYLTFEFSSKSLLSCFREPLFFLMILASFYFYLDFLKRGEKVRSIILSAILIGFACAVRETSILSLIPMAILYVAKYISEKRPAFLKSAIFFATFFSIGISPLLVQNYLNNGNVFYPTQRLYEDIKEYGNNEDSDVVTIRDYSVPGMQLKYFRHTFKQTLHHLRHEYGNCLVCILLLGILFGRSFREIKYFLLPFIAVCVIFYSFYYTRHWRHILLVHMVSVPIMAFGAVKFLEFVRVKKLYILIGTLGFFCFIMCIMFHKIPDDLFQIKHARQFKQDFEGCVPPSSIIISERRMRKIMDYFSNSYWVRPTDFVRPEYGITLEKGIEYFQDKFDNVYFFSNRDLSKGLQHRYNHTPVNKQSILQYFNLTPLRKFDGRVYNLKEHFGKRFCTLSKIEKWTKKTTVQDVDVSDFQDSILRINARALCRNGIERNEAKLYFNDHIMSNSVRNGINYFYMPRDLFWGIQNIKLVSDSFVPSNIEPRIFGIYEDILIELGAKAIPLDINYLSDEFYHSLSESNPSYRNLLRTGKVRIPTIKYPNSTLLLLSTIRFTAESPSQANVSFLLNGHKQCTIKSHNYNQWQTVCIPLQNKDISAASSEFEINIDMVGFKAQKDDTSQSLTPYISIANFTIHRHDNSIQESLINIGEDDKWYIHSGFYHKERHLGKYPVRWTRDTARINLPYFRQKARLMLNIKAWGTPSSVGKKIVEVCVNDKKIGEFALEPEEHQSFYLKVPRKALFLGFNKLELKTNTWRPSDILLSPDERELGIMLDSVTLHFLKS